MSTYTNAIIDIYLNTPAATSYTTEMGDGEYVEAGRTIYFGDDLRVCVAANFERSDDEFVGYTWTWYAKGADLWDQMDTNGSPTLDELVSEIAARVS